MFGIPSDMTLAERLLLLSLARENRRDIDVIVEVGSYLGASACCLAEECRNGSKVFCVDTWQNTAMSEGPRDTYEEFLRNVAPSRDKIVPLRGLSTDIAANFEERIDLLFMDGDHSGEGVWADLEAWLPKVRNGGIVILHDYTWAEGVQRAARELLVPLQVEGGRHVDSTYWTRISHEKASKSLTTLPASVVVPTYRRPEYVSDAVRSIRAQEFPSEGYEILLVDNDPDRGGAPVVEESGQSGACAIRCVHELRNGLHNARHRGAREARGEILVYVDDDVIVHPGWLAAMLEPFADPAVACVGGKVVPKWEAQAPDWVSQLPEWYLSLVDFGDKTRELTTEFVSGCNMAVRRDVVYELGGFHPDSFGDPRLIWLRGDGEAGLLRKIRAAGYKVIYEPRAWLYHRVPASRLTPEYFCTRAFRQGISDSFTVIREYAHMRKRHRMLRHAARCFATAVRYWLSARGQHSDMALKTSAHYWYGKGQHQLRVALSRELREHVFEETYLKE